MIAASQSPDINPGCTDLSQSGSHGLCCCCGGNNIINDGKAPARCKRDAPVGAEGAIYVVLALFCTQASLGSARLTPAAVLQYRDAGST